MTSAHYLILGGGISGTTAAETIRKQDPVGSIVIADFEQEPLYSRVLLPHYVKGMIPEEKLFLRRRSWYEEQRIILRSGERAVGIDPLTNTVTFASHEVIQYKKLLIATGGFPNSWNIPGGDAPSILPLWTIDHARKLRYLLTRNPPPRQAVVVGGGFIMTDLVSIFRHFNLKTTLLMRKPHVFWGLLDAESAGILERAMVEEGVSVFNAAEVAHVHRETHRLSLTLHDGRFLAADVVGLGIGVRTDTSLFQSAGVNVKDSGVETNEYLSTSVPDVWAAGDMCVFFDVHAGLQHKVGNWTNAQEQGRVAGANMVGETRRPFHLVSSYTVELFRTYVSFIGAVEGGPGVAVVPFGDVARNERGRLLFYGNALIGATLVNMPQLRNPLVRAIETHIDLTDTRATLEKGNYASAFRAIEDRRASADV